MREFIALVFSELGVEMGRLTRGQWCSLINEFEHSEGWTHAAFARSKGVELRAFRKWLYRLRDEQRRGLSVQFAEVVVSSCEERLSPAYSLQLPGGVVIELSEAPDPSWLARLCSELQVLS